MIFEWQINILVCTSIIESGLDMTTEYIIINDAQNFGLSQLHQIRGRVGRVKASLCCLGAL